MEELRECVKHGKTLFTQESNGRWRCKKCRVDAVAKKRRNLKLKAVELKGGKCQICGYNKCVDALDFHHLDESVKSFCIASKGYTRAWSAVEKEINKCILVCANCNREIHAGLINPYDYINKDVC